MFDYTGYQKLKTIVPENDSHNDSQMPPILDASGTTNDTKGLPEGVPKFTQNTRPQKFENLVEMEVCFPTANFKNCKNPTLGQNGARRGSKGWGPPPKASQKLPSGIKNCCKTVPPISHDHDSPNKLYLNCRWAQTLCVLLRLRA